MVSVFRQKSPANIVVLLIVGLLLKLPLFLYPRNITATSSDEDLYHVLIGWLTPASGGNGVACSVVAFLLLYAQALLVNHLMNEFRMLGKQTWLPAMAYLLLTSLLPEWNYLSSPLVATTFIIWILVKLLRLYSAQQALGTIFNIGLLLGVASYVYFPSAAFLLTVLVGLLILRPFRLNEAALMLAGGLTPYYFVAAWLFLNDRLSFATFFPHLSVRVPVVRSNVWLAVTTVLVVVPFLAGGYLVQTHLHKMLIQVRKAWSVLLLYLFLSFFVPFVNGYSSFSNWILVAVPFACFHAATFFYPRKRWLPNGLFFLTAAYVLYLQYGTALWRG